MKFYRDLFESSLNRVFPDNDKTAFFQTFYDAFVHMSPETEQHFSRLPDTEGQQTLFKSFFAMLAVDGALSCLIFSSAWRGSKVTTVFTSRRVFSPCGAKRC